MVNESAGSKGGVRCQRWFVRLGAGQNYRRAPAGRVGARTSLGRGPSFGAEGPRRRAGFGCARFFGDCNTVRKEHSQAAVAVTCHVLPRRCRSVVRLFSPVLVLILMGLVPGRVAVFDFRVHEYMAVRDKMSSSPVDLPAASYSVPRRTPRTMVSKFHDREEIRRR
jgi:hypothetical protein